MFDSVLGRAGGPRTQFGKAAVFSAAVHAAIPVALIWFAAQHHEKPADERVIKLIDYIPRGGPKAEVITAKAAPPHKTRPPRHAIVQPVDPTVLPPVPGVTPPVEPPTTSDVAATADSSKDDGSGAGPLEGAKVSSEGGSNAGGSGDGPVVWTAGQMSQPRMLEGDPIEYPRAALQAHVEGLTVVSCVITTTGTIEQCRTIKPLPYMEDAVMRSLHSRRYTPVLVDGKPVAVKYVFAIKMVLPH